MMYLMLSVAGHLTIFLARTRGPFWSARPARILWVAVLGTQIIATLFAGFGIFMTPLGWGWVAVVWGYAIAWFLIRPREAARLPHPRSRGRQPSTGPLPDRPRVGLKPCGPLDGARRRT